MTELLKVPGAYVENGVVYPESDGQPISDNTEQFEWIITIEGGIADLFRDDPNVFVAGDLLWYPVQGRNDIRFAPDVMVVFGRPQGKRGSYLQWVEDNIPPQVVFEIISPSNTRPEMVRKRKAYEQYGVEEFYIYDPDRRKLEGWLRQNEQLVQIPQMSGWVSPRLGIRFEMSSGQLEIFRPDGERFTTFLETYAQKRLEREQRKLAQQRADQAQFQADQEQERAEQAQAQAEQERTAKERAWAKLRELGIDPETLL